MILIRLLLRFLLVPLGACIAICVGAAVVLFAHWNKMMAAISADTAANADILVALLLVGSIFALVLSIVAVFMLLPATIGLLIAEAFAIRSWIYHAINGGLSVWLGWLLMEDTSKKYEFFDVGPVVIGAGIAAGFAYWAIAGWSAGFWKPVFAPPPMSKPPESTPAISTPN